LHDHGVAVNSLGDDQNGGAITRALNNVGLTVSVHFANFHLGRTFIDIIRNGQLAREFTLSAWCRGKRGFFAPLKNDQLFLNALLVV